MMLRFAGLLCQHVNPGNLLMKRIIALLFCLIPAINYLIAQDHASSSKKEWGISVSTPFINVIRFHDYYRGKNEDVAGFLGIGLGGYYRKDAFKFSLHGSIIAISPSPWGFGGLEDNYDTYVNKTGIDALVQYALLKKLILVGGINYYNLRYKQPLAYEKITIKKHDASFGFTAGVEFFGGRFMSFGLYYRPAVIEPDKKINTYSLSLGLKADIAVWRNFTPEKKEKKRRKNKQTMYYPNGDIIPIIRNL